MDGIILRRISNKFFPGACYSNIWLLLASAFYLTLTFAPTISHAADLRFHSTAKAQISVATVDENFDQHQSIKSQSTLFQVTPEITLKSEHFGKLTSLIRVKYQGNDGFRNTDVTQSSYNPNSKPYLHHDSSQLELREIYWEVPIKTHYLTVGKQQVVWGKTDGLKLLDIVNPQTFTEFILEDFDESRIPLWAANLELSTRDNSTLQIVWIPDTTVHSLPTQSGRYAFSSPRIISMAHEEFTVVIDNPHYPPNHEKSITDYENAIADSDYGIKYASFVLGWDISLNYLNHYDDLPAFYRALEVVSGINQIRISPRYERTEIIGGTATTAFGELTFRTELAFTRNQHFIVNDPASETGITHKDEFAVVLGFDWYGLSNALLSIQVFNSHVIKAPDTLTRPITDTTTTLLIQKEFFNDTLSNEIIFIHNTYDKDGLLRPKISFAYSDETDIWLGADIYYGNKAGLYGQFNNNDRIVFGVEYGF
ncbi:MAG: hypothetical protein ACI93R_002681 [Flavobacteriales bacterium]|jgi:hypothetical protein